MKKKMSRFLSPKVIGSVILLMVCVLSCILRAPDYDTMVWNASDTNYQCLMNAKAMIEAGKWQPLITFPQEDDYGVEYSSGAFDQETGRYFYYVSFPLLAYAALRVFFVVTGFPVGLEGLYYLTSFLYCLACIEVYYLFLYLFSEEKKSYWPGLIAGFCFAFSTEIMHSQGLLYWGHSWSAVLFPLALLLFFEQRRKESQSFRIGFCVILLLLLQTEWTGYFYAFSFFAFELYRTAKARDRKQLLLPAIIVLEVAASLLFYLSTNIRLVGMEQFVSVMQTRFVGRTRVTDYGVIIWAKALITSFAPLVFLGGVFTVWSILKYLYTKKKPVLPEQLGLVLFLLSFPVLENLVFMNHALIYSMDRVKWFYPGMLLLLIEWNYIAKGTNARTITTVLFVGSFALNYVCYTYLDNSYCWHDDRLKKSIVLEEYLSQHYSDSVLGQMGNNSVWGYTKLLFNRGVQPFASVEQMREKSVSMDRRYAITLLDYDLGYTQKWYYGAVIYDNQAEEYTVMGSFSSRFAEKMDELAFLKNAECIQIFKDGFEKQVWQIDFAPNEELAEKEEKVNIWLTKENRNDELYYFFSAEDIPSYILVNDMTDDELWNRGVNETTLQLMFQNNEANIDLLDNAIGFRVGELRADVVSIENADTIIYANIRIPNSEEIVNFCYPNVIEVIK